MGQEPSQIRQEIEETRAEMGDTVDALAYKADVKARMKESIADKRDRLISQVQGTTHRMGEATPDGQQVKKGARQAVGVAEENPIGLALGGVAAGFLVWRTNGSVRSPTRSRKRRWKPVRSRPKSSKSTPWRAPSRPPGRHAAVADEPGSGPALWGARSTRSPWSRGEVARHCLRPVADVQRPQDLADVPFDRALAEVEARRDLAVAESFGDETEDLDLA
jgi:hypothetical protein